MGAGWRSASEYRQRESDRTGNRLSYGWGLHTLLCSTANSLRESPDHNLTSHQLRWSSLAEVNSNSAISGAQLILSGSTPEIPRETCISVGGSTNTPLAYFTPNKLGVKTGPEEIAPDRHVCVRRALGRIDAPAPIQFGPAYEPVILEAHGPFRLPRLGSLRCFELGVDS